MLRRLALPIFALFMLVAATEDVHAQGYWCPGSCGIQGRTITGSVTIGDGSTPTGNSSAGLWMAAPACGDSWGGPAYGDNPAVTIIYTPPPQGCPFGGTASGWYSWTIGGNVTCTVDTSGCCQCGGSFNLVVYSSMGTFSGTVWRLPDNIPAAGAPVRATHDSANWYGTATNAAGAYTFTPASEVNNWGVWLYDRPGGSTGPSSSTYMIWTPGILDVPATTSSNENKVVDLTIFNEEPTSCSPTSPSVHGPSTVVGQPVSCVSGNMSFAEADAEIPSRGGDILFARTYNSAARGAGQYGVFGPGWSHAYERRVEVLRAGVLKLRRADGLPRYFADPGGTGHFEESVPFSREEWIDKEADGSYRLGFRRGGFETYSAGGQLTSIVDASGNTTTLGYVSGKLTTITSPSGRSLSLGYAGSQLTSLSGPAGAMATYSYLNGRLDTVHYTDAAGSGFKFGYDPNTGALLKVEDLAGKPVETHAYDGSGRATTSEIADGQEKYTLEYGPGLTRVADALGNVTTYTFSQVWGQNVVTKITGPCASCGAGSDTQEWTYDKHARVTSYKNGAGDTWSYTYSPDGDLLSETDPAGHAITYTYDAEGRILTTTLADGGQTTFTHGPAGPLTVTDAVNRTTTITYTAEGRPQTITDGRNKTTTLAYNAAADLVSVTDPLTHVTAFGYDSLGRRVTVTDALNHTTTTTYDARGRVTRITSADSTHTDFTYDQSGRRATVTDPLGHTTRYVYDGYLRLEKVVDASGGVTQYGYDLMSNLVSLTDARLQTTRFEYDAFNRVSRVVYPHGSAETFTYDTVGRLKTGLCTL